MHLFSQVDFEVQKKLFTRKGGYSLNGKRRMISHFAANQDTTPMKSPGVSTNVTSSND